MREPTVGSFQITPSQYGLFRFTITRPTTLRVRMIATAPVKVLLLDSDGRAEYESGAHREPSYTVAWGRRSDLDETVNVDPGTWYLAVEGSTEPSKGRIEVFQ